MGGYRTRKSVVWKLALAVSVGAGMGLPAGIPASGAPVTGLAVYGTDGAIGGLRREVYPSNAGTESHRRASRNQSLAASMAGRGQRVAGMAGRGQRVAGMAGRGSQATSTIGNKILPTIAPVAAPVAAQAAPTVLKILSPADGRMVSKHEPGVGAGLVPLAWQGIAAARSYSINLFDSTTRSAVLHGVNAGLATTYGIADSVLKYGHGYTFSVAAVTGEGVVTDTARFRVPILPELTSSTDLRLHNGEIVWENCTPGLLSSRDQFAAILAARGWTIRYTSAYRSLTYQEHLYLIAKTPIRTLSRSDAARIAAERIYHQLSRSVARPGVGDSHVAGKAFDAIVFDERGRARNSRNWRDRRVEDMARRAGLTML
ncbi:MAG: D-alanyl-D-alanine carboxypeptidase family protein, partial [Micromonosporaceae bacterium]|nr:D-alanyl-D-alanine carboxypeptidase family protein [Micromonosporaceae bacterium]